MKNTVYVVILSVFLAISGITGFSTVVKAGNTSDTSYSFYNAIVDDYTDGRAKLDSTKVYIYPNSGPALYYTVQGGSNGSWSNRSNRHVVNNGVQASFTNFVYENNEHSARLHLERLSTAYDTTYGVWSPDSSRNYTIFN